MTRIMYSSVIFGKELHKKVKSRVLARLVVSCDNPCLDVNGVD